MSRSLSYLRQGLFGIVFVGSMGFGASQALAAPQQTSQAAVCDSLECLRDCVNYGYSYGDCHPTLGFCYCYP